MIENDFINRILRKDKRAVSRAITYVESGNENSIDLLKKIHSRTGTAYRIGITGPPGAGKSTLTNYLTKLYRKENKTVGVIAVDPTSPFTGGALLGDRIRMGEIGNDEGVFIRSMATRGSLGGLSAKTIDAADILDAAGFDFIIFETVGVGQSELDIVKAADTTIVVLVPESGDSIQAMKAGLMEIADFFVLNKSDRPGSDSAIMALQTILMLKNQNVNSWSPDILKTVASENKGIEDIANEITAHKNYMNAHNILTQRRKDNSKLRVKEIVQNILLDEIWDQSRKDELNKKIADVVEGNKSPYVLADEIIKSYKTKNH